MVDSDRFGVGPGSGLTHLPHDLVMAIQSWANSLDATDPAYHGQLLILVNITEDSVTTTLIAGGAAAYETIALTSLN